MSFGTWFDYYNSPDVWFETNLAAWDVINLLDYKDPADCIRNLVEDNNLVAMTIDPITEEIILFHHFTRIRKLLKKKTAKANEKVVALNGFGHLASIVRFKFSSNVFDLKLVVSIDVPSDNHFEQFEKSEEFSKLTPKSGNTKSFHNIIILPPFVIVAFLSISNRSASKLA